MSANRPQKGAKKPQNLRNVHQHPETKHRRYLGLRGSKSDSEGTQSTRNPPLFVVSNPRNRPNGRLDTRTSGHLVVAGGQPGARTGGANSGSMWVPRATKNIFSEVVPRPLGMLKHVFLARFEPVVARFGPWKIPKSLENGSYWDPERVKNGSKTHLSRNDPEPFGMLTQVFLAHFEAIGTGFGPWKSQNALKRGRFGSKNG